MTSGESLRLHLDKVSTTAGDGFDVVDVDDAPGFKVGRDASHAVILLTPADEAPEPPTLLQRISADPRIALVVTHPDGRVEEGEFGMVSLRLGQTEYLDSFLHVMANLVALVGPDPSPGEVSIAFRRLVQLFENAAAPRGSVLGLWGELLLLGSSSEPAKLLDSWHLKLDAKFDFADQGSRLEVKTTTGSTRLHHFSVDQLQPVVGSSTVVASIMTTETQAGTSVQELIEDAEELFANDASRQMRLHEVVAGTLGLEWARHVDRRFDAQQALSTLRLLPAHSIPRVRDVPPGVSGVQFVSDCTDVERETAPHGLASLIVSQAE